MPFEAYKIYEEYEPDKYKTSTQKKVEQALDTAKEEGLVPEAKEAGSELEEAQEIMKENFLGPTAVENTFGIHLEVKDIPPIPFSTEELKRAEGLKQFLILRVDQIPADKLNLPNTKQTLEKAPATGWALVSKELIPGSTGNNYLEQTNQIVKYLQTKVFPDGLPVEYQAAVDEYNGQKAELEGLIKSDWSTAAQRFEELKITKLTRQSRDEALYDLEVYYQIKKQYLLPNLYTWTSSRSSVGGLVSVGGFDAEGANVYGDRPGYRSGNLGVSLSRSR